jgi:hypothetical protein
LLTGAAATVVGLATGTAVIVRRSELADECHQNHCLGEAASKLESTRTLADVSTVSLGVGIVGLAIGSYLWLRQTSAPPTAANSRQGATMRPIVAGFTF